MSGCTVAHLLRIRDRHRNGTAPIQTFVETGTYRGAGARRAIQLFPVVHTIEIAAALYERARAAFRGMVHCHLGDSRHLVPVLAASLTEPVVWYLDAHWFRVPEVGGQEEGLPLWDELTALASRPYPDIVIVDDVHDFGKDKPTPEWREVTLERIASYFPGHREAVILGDQAVIYR